MTNFDSVRKDFRALDQKVHGHDLVYLDSAATTLKPEQVVQRITQFYNYETANVHRGAHYLSDRATNDFEAARETIRHFIGAQLAEEVLFTKGTTDSVNLVAQALSGVQQVQSSDQTNDGLSSWVQEGDEIWLTEMEHHSNIVPWQVLATRKKAQLKFIPVLENGELDIGHLDQLFSKKTKLVAITACSNILGTLTPLNKIVEQARKVGALVFVDGAQYVSQKKVEVEKLGVDFFAFSAHKLFGPFGFGVLYVNKNLMTQLPCYQFGGSMISTVEALRSTFNIEPFRFEAGTPHVEGAVGTAEAIKYFTQFDINEVFKYEHKLYKAAVDGLKNVEGVRLFGEASEKAAILSFTIQNIHHSDIGQILDQQGVAVRVGHHCTQPLLKKFGLTGTVRASISIYNNLNDVDRFVEAVKKAKRMLS